MFDRSCLYDLLLQSRRFAENADECRHLAIQEQVIFKLIIWTYEVVVLVILEPRIACEPVLQRRYLALDLEDFAIVALLSASLDMELLRHERDLE